MAKSIITHKSDLLVISVAFVVLVIIATFIHANYLTTVFLYYGFPALYLSFRKPKMIKKSFLYAMLFALPATFILDYMGHVSKTWYEPSVIGLRVLHAFPIDAFIWSIIFSYFVTVFYEYFFEQTERKLFSHNTRYFFYLVASLLLIFLTVYVTDKAWLAQPRFYLLFIVALALFPSITVLGRHPRLLPKITLAGLFFIPYQIIYELSALHLGNWNFPGTHYIGWVELFDYRFPFEELLWIFLVVPAFLCIYEYFFDDLR